LAEDRDAFAARDRERDAAERGHASAGEAARAAVTPAELLAEVPHFDRRCISADRQRNWL
jgi:hypothetical protein